MNTQKKHTLLTDEEITRHLKELQGWSINDMKLTKEYSFKDFNDCFSFMTRGALISEALNHHPEWSNVYNRLKIQLTTHDLGGVSSKDIEWIYKVEKL
jgi:4a-hydroxytetrahydrobiopterin dehydratase